MKIVAILNLIILTVLSSCNGENTNPSSSPSVGPHGSPNSHVGAKQVSLFVSSTRQCSLDVNHHATCWLNNNPISGWPKKNNADLAGQKFDRIAGDAEVLCAIDTQGKVRCIIPTETSKKTPAEIEALGKFSQVACLKDRVCALTLSKEIICHQPDFSTDVPADDFVSPDEIIEIAAGWYLKPANVYGEFGCWITTANKLSCHAFADAAKAAAPTESADRIVQVDFDSTKMMTLSTDKKNVKYFGQSRAIKKDHPIDLTKPHKAMATFRNHVCVVTQADDLQCGAFDFAPLPEKTDAEIKKISFKAMHPGVYFCGQKTDDTSMCWKDKDLPANIPSEIKAD